MDYRFLDELDVPIEGEKSPLEENHKKLMRSQEEYAYIMAREEINYRIWQHDFFPYKKKRKKRW